jgi:hypothetical protein
VEIIQFLPNHIYELRVKSATQSPRTSMKGDRKYVTLVTELGKHKDIEVKDSDSEAKQAAILRNLNIHGSVRILIEGR